MTLRALPLAARSRRTARFALAALLLSAAVLISACSGGGSGDTGSVSTSAVLPSPTNSTVASNSGSGPDTIPPAISLAAPSNGSTVSATVTITANASDNIGVAGVQFKLDGANLGGEITASPYSISWNTTSAPNGLHTLTATARDAAGNTTSAGISITVSNTISDTQIPTIPTGLSAITISTSQINLSWQASTDNVGVTGYRVYRNNSQISTTTTTSYNDTGLSSSTTYTYTVSAYDAAGNVSAQSNTVVATTQTPPSSAGNSYFVSTSGNDSNPGTLANPFRTVAHATSVAVAGDTIYLRGGTYSENNIAFANSGTSSQPITLTRYQSETPIIGISSTGDSYGGTLSIDGKNYIVIDHVSIIGGVPSGIHIGRNNVTHDITVQYSDISNWYYGDNNGGIFVDASGVYNLNFNHNYIHDWNSSGSSTGSACIILFQVGALSIKNNEMNNCSIGLYSKHSPVATETSSVIVENNYIHNNTYRAIRWNRRNTTFKNNVISDNTHGFQSLEASAACANLVTDNLLFVHNTFVATTNDVINFNNEQAACPGPVNSTLRDNIFYDWTPQDYRGIGLWVYSPPGSPYPADGNTTLDHNLIYSAADSTPIKIGGMTYTAAAAPTLTNTGNIQLAPTFVDYANRALSLSNLALITGSNGHNAASDGTDMGADVTLVGIGH